MKILCLYSNECALELFHWLKEQGHDTILETGRLDTSWCIENRFDLAVGYTYPYILGEKIIVAWKNNVVNLHNSFLQFNRGSYPNVWSMVEDTPRGVTLHYINTGLDKGDIISQKIVTLEKDATLRSSYEQLDQEAKRMFQEMFLYYNYWNRLRKRCVGEGTYHTDKEFLSLKDQFEYWSWDMSVQNFIEKVKCFKLK